MIVPSDADYIQTKLIKQGNAKLNPDFEPLAVWINEYYQVKVLNIYYDKITGAYNKEFPRLSIIFECEEEEQKFTNERTGNFDSGKQELITKKFHQLVVKKNSSPGLFASLFKNSKYESDQLLVIFESFRPVAVHEANRMIPQDKIDDLKRQLASKKIWEIYREFSTTVYFFYTQKEIEDYTADGTTSEMTQQYLEILKQYDEFNYIDQDLFSLEFDSKENFDKKFQGNWFYYSRR